MKSPIKDTPKEDNLSTKDKMAGPEGVLIKRFHCNGPLADYQNEQGVDKTRDLWESVCELCAPTLFHQSDAILAL